MDPDPQHWLPVYVTVSSFISPLGNKNKEGCRRMASTTPPLVCMDTELSISSLSLDSQSPHEQSPHAESLDVHGESLVDRILITADTLEVELLHLAGSSEDIKASHLRFFAEGFFVQWDSARKESFSPWFHPVLRIRIRAPVLFLLTPGSAKGFSRPRIPDPQPISLIAL